MAQPDISATPDAASATAAAGTQATQATQAAPRTVGIVGLGLIGGSFARAYAAAGWRVLAEDTDPRAIEQAAATLGAVPLTSENLPTCDLVVLAAYPGACLTWLRSHAQELAPATLTIDAAGVKGAVCDEAFELSRTVGFAYCGAHPMAGTEFSGFAHSRQDLFRGAPMVLTPPTHLDADARLDLIDRVQELLTPCGFGSFSVTTPEEHDRVIAFTSQLAHVVSNAYVKSPTAREHHGFSAGSYRDLTRVAHLNPVMWSELMVDNARALTAEIDHLVLELGRYRDALAARDAQALRKLLAEGDRIKRSLDDQRDEPQS